MPTRTDSPSETIYQSSNSRSERWAFALLMRLHFYIGLMVGPFILIAAFTGALYIISPQIENIVYSDQLQTSSVGDAVPLAMQIRSARMHVGETAKLAAVRPAPEVGGTTRVMFDDSSLGQYQHRAIFVDPVTARVLGDLPVYGTSGALPFRTWIDLLHRSLHMGDFGRHYSELAASWLWIVALGGAALWYIRRRDRLGALASVARNNDANANTQPARARLSGRHSTMGLVLMAGLLFVSVTGLTWSQWAGSNISTLRTHLDWGTPGVNTSLIEAPTSQSEEHHHGHVAASDIADTDKTWDQPAQFDAVLASARAAGINAGLVQIKPPSAAGQAWTVTEIDRRWPTQVDAAAIDPNSLNVIDQTDFTDFPLAAKLTRWGIDAHMGVLFGLPNQLLLLFFALGLCTMVIWGYCMWWARRPTKERSSGGHLRVFGALRKTPPMALAGIIVVTGLLGWFLPVLGVSLVAFLALDFALGRYQRART